MFVTIALGIGIAFLCSITTAIWTVVVGENIKGICLHERIIHVLLCTAVYCVDEVLMRSLTENTLWRNTYHRGWYCWTAKDYVL